MLAIMGTITKLAVFPAFELKTAKTLRSSSLTAPYFYTIAFFITHFRGSLEAIKFADLPNFKIIDFKILYSVYFDCKILK